MNVKRECKKCHERHWPWLKCATIVNDLPESKESGTNQIEAQNKMTIVQSKPATKYAGFPRLGNQFGFQAGVPFSKHRSKWPREGLDEKN